MRFDFAAPMHTIQGLVNDMLAALPRLTLAVLIGLVFWFVGRGVRSGVRRMAKRHGDMRALELAAGRLAQSVIVIVGILVAVLAAFPSFTPADFISTLGIGGVAIGFAFKDIFQNFLAGVLILVTKPFRVGDQIIFKTFEGTVEDIQTRATFLKTYDGRRIIIPNGDLYTNAVTVNTAFRQRRLQYDIGIGYGDDVEKARALILDVLRDLPTVSPEPVADVIVTALGESAVILRARWWSDSRMADALKAQDAVLTRLKARLEAAGIDLPFPTRVVLLHDQTEATDGVRGRQREGWPAGDGPVPPARAAVRAEAPPL